jgi:hypothetical protein
VERFLKNGYEVLSLINELDEDTISALPEFEGKKVEKLMMDSLCAFINSK